MARIRTIKPAFFRSLTVTELPKPTRLTWIGLWTYVDDSGRGVDDARLIKAELWPLDDDYTAKKVEKDLQLLEANGSIRRYVVDGRKYLHIVEWHHQRIDKPTPTVLPEPPEMVQVPLPSDSQNAPGTLPEASVQEKEEGLGREQGKDIAPAPADAEKPARLRDALWDSMLAACEIHEQPTESARGAYNRARKDLAGVGATPEEIHRRAGIHRLKWPDISLTPSSLARHWAECAVAPLHRSNGERPRRPTNVENSIANIMEGTDDRGRGPEDSRRPGHFLAPARALEAGT